MCLALIGLAAISVRLPFLLRADRFFDADEAVEGLMARHLGDHSLFLWGQGYKGTPEVFLTGAVFQLTGASVVAIKAVTLTVFVAFLLLDILLVERLFSQRVAWIATTIFLIGPPSLVFWSLSGSAEIAMTLLAGVVLLLAVDTKKPLIASGAAGFGLWIHQYILYYVAALALTMAAVHRDRLTRFRAVLQDRVPAWLAVVLWLVIVVAMFYSLLGLVAFFSGGIEFTIAGVRVTATHPQKMWWIAAGLLLALGVSLAAATFKTRLVPPALGFIAGYFPAILGGVGAHSVGTPIAHMNVDELVSVLPQIRDVMAPMLLGSRDPLGLPTSPESLVFVIAAIVAVSYWEAYTRRLPPVFHVLLLVVPLMFFVSGSYRDAQSYRYLMPMYAALPIVCAIGIDTVWRNTRSGGAALTLVLVGMFGVQQIVWYAHLRPDAESARAIACLDRAGIHLARAGYWQSYKITFLTDERIVVAPVDGLDRYPPYTTQTREAPLLDTAASCQ